MRYYELIATKGERKIVERFLDDGRRFIKYIPYNPSVFISLKQQFTNKPVTVEENNLGWVIITKEDRDEQMEEAARSVIGDEELTKEMIYNAEKEMLQKAGFKVKITQGEI